MFSEIASSICGEFAMTQDNVISLNLYLLSEVECNVTRRNNIVILFLSRLNGYELTGCLIRSIG